MGGRVYTYNHIICEVTHQLLCCQEMLRWQLQADVWVCGPQVAPRSDSLPKLQVWGQLSPRGSDEP